MTKKTFAFVAAALMSLSIAATGCSKNKNDAKTTPAAGEAKPAEGAAPAPEGGDAKNPCQGEGGAANPCQGK